MNIEDSVYIRIMHINTKMYEKDAITVCVTDKDSLIEYRM